METYASDSLYQFYDCLILNVTSNKMERSWAEFHALFGNVDKQPMNPLNDITVKTDSHDVMAIKKWTQNRNCVWYIRCNNDSRNFHFECRVHQENDTVVSRMEIGLDKIGLYVLPSKRRHPDINAYQLDDSFRVAMASKGRLFLI